MEPGLRYTVSRIVFAGLVALAVSWVATPIVVSSLYAFAEPESFYDPRQVVPLRYTLENIKLLLDLGAYDAIVNSVVVAVLTILFSFALGLPAGYALARYAFRGRDTLKLAIVGFRMFPLVVMGVPLVALYIRIGLSDTLLGVALAHTAMALPFVVLITSSIFAGVPRDLEEAGLVFGLTRLGVFLRITMPLALPGLTAAAIFTFLMSWNEVFVAAVLTLQHRTLPAFVLTAAQGSGDVVRFAASFIMILPAVVFVFFARRYLVTMWGITLR